MAAPYIAPMNSTLAGPSVHRNIRGFTLLELLTTIAVVAIVAAVAVPNLRDFIRNNRLTGEANDLLRSIQVARGEAIKRQQDVVMCASGDPTVDEPTCSYSFAGAGGWIVFQDSDSNWQRDDEEEVIERHQGISTVTSGNNNDAIISYSRTGFVNPADEMENSTWIVFCDDRGNQSVGNNSTARALQIEPTGRSRVTKNYDDVADAIEATDSCT